MISISLARANRVEGVQLTWALLCFSVILLTFALRALCHNFCLIFAFLGWTGETVRKYVERKQGNYMQHMFIY